eukprot:gene22777-biopygen13311
MRRGNVAYAARECGVVPRRRGNVAYRSECGVQVQAARGCGVQVQAARGCGVQQGSGEWRYNRSTARQRQR